MDAGTVVAVCISDEKGVVKKPVDEVFAKLDYGIVGDAHAGSDGHRQVSLLADESVDKLRDRIPDLSAGVFAENILTSGISLCDLPLGTRLRVGDTMLRVTQIGKECHNDGCAIRRQTGECVMPHEGIFTVVIKEGAIKPGDAVSVYVDPRSTGWDIRG